MLNGNQRFKFILILCVMVVSNNVFSCMTTFVNDSGNKIAIFNKNDKTFTFIPKNKKRRFGNHEQHAYFVIYVQQPKERVFSPVYECQQNECGSTGNILLKFTEVQNNSGNAALFTIKKFEPHSSMVHELPMIKKTHCHACPAE